MNSRFVLVSLAGIIFVNGSAVAQSGSRMPADSAAPIVQPATPMFEGAMPPNGGMMESSVQSMHHVLGSDCGCGNVQPTFSSGCCGTWNNLSYPMDYFNGCGCGDFDSCGWNGYHGHGLGGFRQRCCRPHWFGRRIGGYGCGF